MLLLGPGRVEAVYIEVVLAFAATEIPFICCQVAAPRIFAQPACKWIWDEIHFRVAIAPFDVQRRVVAVHTRHVPNRQGRRLWLLVGNFVICSFRGAVGQTSPLIAAWQLPISGSAAAKLWFARGKPLGVQNYKQEELYK